MTAQIIDGKSFSAELRTEAKTRAAAFERRYGRPPGLDVVLVGDDPASHVYVRNKERACAEAGIRGVVHRLDRSTSLEALLATVDRLNAAPEVDGILVQLPLPDSSFTERVIDRIDPRKDVDGLHPVNAGLLSVGRSGLRPCTPTGCMWLLHRIGVDPAGKRAIVVGRSNLVGKPIALMLLEANATVTVAHSRSADLAALVAEADIVVAAVGKLELVRGSWIKPGAIVLDVGMNRNAAGKLAGDVEFDAARERASFITPVPGGVGAMTIAALLTNTLEAAELRAAHESLLTR